MAETLDFADKTWEGARGTIFTVLQSLHNSVEGNGKAGLKEEMTDVRLELAEIKAYGKATSFWAKVIAGLLSLAIAMMGVYLAIVHH